MPDLRQSRGGGDGKLVETGTKEGRGWGLTLFAFERWGDKGKGGRGY